MCVLRGMMRCAALIILFPKCLHAFCLKRKTYTDEDCMNETSFVHAVCVYTGLFCLSHFAGAISIVVFLNVRNTFYSSSCKSVLHASTNTIQNIETRVKITVISGRYIWKSLCICLKLLSIFAWSAAWAQILFPRARKNSTICLSLLLF